MFQEDQFEEAIRPDLMAWRRSFSSWSWIRIPSIARDITESGVVGLCRKIPSNDGVRVEVFLFMSLVYSRSGQIDRACGPLPQLTDLDLDLIEEGLGFVVEHVRTLVGCVGASIEQNVGLDVVPLNSLGGEGVEEALLLVGCELERDGLGFVHEFNILGMGVD